MQRQSQKGNRKIEAETVQEGATQTRDRNRCEMIRLRNYQFCSRPDVTHLVEHNARCVDRRRSVGGWRKRELKAKNFCDDALGITGIVYVCVEVMNVFFLEWAGQRVVGPASVGDAEHQVNLSGQDLLAISTMPHEVLLLRIRVAAATGTAVDRIPGTAVMITVMSVWGLPGGELVSGNIGRVRLGLVSRVLIIEHGPVESRTPTRCTEILGGMHGGIGCGRGGEVRRRVVVDPGDLIVGRVESRLRAFQRGSLVVAHVGLGVGSHTGDIGINLGERCGGEPVEGGLAFQVLGLAPVLPAGNPSVVVAALVEVDVQVVLHALQPLVLQGVQLGHLNSTDLRPGSILEGVVVEELAAQEEANGQHPPDHTLTCLGGCRAATQSIQLVGATGEIIHAEQDGGAGESGRGEETRDELPEGR
jgi:hypothetical protein